MGVKKSDIEYQWALAVSLLNDDTAARFLKPTGRNGEYKKSDYISALSKLNAYRHHGHTLSTDLSATDIWNALTPSERFRLSFYTPCLARPIDDLNADEQRDIYDDPDWVFTEKHRGVRATIIVNDGITNMYSRNYSDDGSLIDYANRIDQHPQYGGTYAVDVILTLTEPLDISDDLSQHNMSTESRPEQMLGLLNIDTEAAIQLQRRAKQQYGLDLITFHLVHPLYVNGINYLKRPLGDGMDVYDETIRVGQQIGLNIQPIRRSNATTAAEKRVFLKSILDNNGDGVVAQNRNGMYDTSDRRNKSSYVKIKRTTDDRMGDTIDTFLTGAENGKIILSIYEERDGQRFRKTIAKIKTPKRIESQLYAGAVIELSGRGVNPSGMIVQPKFVKMRTDKTHNECVYTTEFLRAQTNHGFYY